MSRFSHRVFQQIIAHAHEAVIAVGVEKARESSLLFMLGLAALAVAIFALQSAMQVASAE